MIERSRLAELLRYGMASAASAVVTLGLPVLLHEGFQVDERVAVAIAFATVFVMNFIIQRLFVFKSAGRASGEIARYTVTSVVFRGAEYIAFLLLFRLGLVYWLAQLIVVGVSFVVKFLTLRYFVYGNKLPADPAP